VEVFSILSKVYKIYNFSLYL